MSSKNLLIATMVGILTLFSSIAGATSITPTDYDGFTTTTLGSLVNGPATYDILSTTNVDIGDLTTSVYDNSGVYTYVLEVTPEQDNVSEFNTAFDVNGFNNIAGYSFLEAGAAIGATGDDFSIDHEGDGTIDWDVLVAGAWDSSEQITLFYQSSRPAYLGDYYNVINGKVGSALGYAPSIPDPAAVFLLGSACMIGFTGARRKFKKK